VEKIIAVANANLGPKAARYFEELARDATQKSAARAAGISDGMARRYQRRMRTKPAARHNKRSLWIICSHLTMSRVPQKCRTEPREGGFS
jgi:hypothetical protein